jgi:hypoxanthine phosphoribosyltransferase
VEVKATWTGFEIPDRFVVGYGIDYAQRNRNLPYIGAVRFVAEAGAVGGAETDSVTS